jgi:hypothetical protein
MKKLTVTLTLFMFSGAAAAQNPDPSKWMCRNLSESGGFLYQGETVFGSQACRTIQQAGPAANTPTDSPQQARPRECPAWFPSQQSPDGNPSIGSGVSWLVLLAG